MGKEVRFNIKFNIDGKDKIGEVTSDVDELKKGLEDAEDNSESFRNSLIKFNSISQVFQNVASCVQQIAGAVHDLTKTYAVQEESEAKLAVTMRNSMNATDEQIAKIKELTSVQQEQGVIGDEVQLAGAQELATYLGLTSSLETLIPVLNDMNAQQYGLNATTESSVTIATMLGKVMNGQVEALSRYGYSFDDAQKQILQFGTESERAAVLAEVVGASVGGMNAALAQTDSGKQKQLENTLGDVKEKFGEVLASMEPVITYAAQIGMGFSGLASGVTSIAGAVKVIRSFEIGTSLKIKIKLAV